jgi:hypothetical protein
MGMTFASAIGGCVLPLAVENAGLSAAASVHGDTTAFWWAAGIFAAGLLVALLVLPNPGRAAHRAPVAEQPEMALEEHAMRPHVNRSSR